MKKDGGRSRACRGTFLEPGTAVPAARPVASPPAPPAPAPLSLAAGSASPGTWSSQSKSAARLRLCKLAAAAACDASRRGAALPWAGPATVGALGAANARWAGASAAPGEGGLGARRPRGRCSAGSASAGPCGGSPSASTRPACPGLARCAGRRADEAEQVAGGFGHVPALGVRQQRGRQRPGLIGFETAALVRGSEGAPPSPSGEPPKPKGTNGCVPRSAACTASAAAPLRPVSPPPPLPACCPACLGPGAGRAEQPPSSRPGSQLSLPGELIRSWTQGASEGARGDRPGGGGEGLTQWGSGRGRGGVAFRVEWAFSSSSP